MSNTIEFRCPPELEGLLPRPVQAKKGIAKWLRDMPAKVVDPVLQGKIMTVKKCPPFVDAMGAGFLIGLPCDVEISRGVFHWNWDLPATGLARHSRAPMAMHPATQMAGAPRADAERALVKFNNFWTISVSEGWSLLCLHPINRLDLPFTCLTGLVDADRYNDNFINFVAEWHDPAFEGTLAKGTPVAQVIPVKRADWAPSFGTISSADAHKTENLRDQLDAQTGVYRRSHRARK